MKQIGIASIFIVLLFSCNPTSQTTDKEEGQQEITEQTFSTQAEEDAIAAAEALETEAETQEVVEEKEIPQSSKPKPTEKTETPKPKPAPKPTPTETTKPKPTPAPKPSKPAPKKPSKEEIEAKIKKKLESKKPTPKPSTPALSHATFDGLLRKYVTSSGQVNYKGFQNEEKQLDAYLKLLSDNANQMGWSRNKKMAYWINAYNAGTIKLILDNYPTSSIMKIENGKPWDKNWIDLGGKSYSLNQIENKILRPKFNDPRIHFAVNCAAKSCPKLLNRAWTASNLESNFEQQTRSFVNSSFNKIQKDKIELSKIFDWYKGDFGDLIDFLNKYSNTPIDKNANVSYIDYDWNLNE